MKKYTRGFASLILIAIIAIVAVGGGIYVYTKNKSENTVVDTNVQATSTSTSSVDQYKNWKTYTNTTYNYSIEYPADWHVNTSNSNQGFTARGENPVEYMGGDTSITNYSDAYMEDYRKKNGALEQPSDYFAITLNFTKVNSNLSLANYIKSQTFSFNTSQNVNLNGTEGIKFTILNKDGIGGNTKPNSAGYILKKNEKVVHIGYGFDSSVKAEATVGDKIINTFILR